MRFMVLVKASKASEAGEMPSKALIEAMGRFNEDLVQRGMMLDGGGLKPSSAGARIRFSGGRPIVSDGPFPETKELVAGFWMVQAPSLADVIETFERCPGPENGKDGDIEIRPFFEAEDFPADVLTPEARAREDRMRAEIERNTAR